MKIIKKIIINSNKIIMIFNRKKMDMLDCQKRKIYSNKMKIKKKNKNLT